MSIVISDPGINLIRNVITLNWNSDWNFYSRQWVFVRSRTDKTKKVN